MLTIRDSSMLNILDDKCMLRMTMLFIEHYGSGKVRPPVFRDVLLFVTSHYYTTKQKCALST